MTILIDENSLTGMTSLSDAREWERERGCCEEQRAATDDDDDVDVDVDDIRCW